MTPRAHAKPPTARDGLEGLAVATTATLATIWITAGIWNVLRRDDLPRWYWWPLIATAVPVVVASVVTYVRRNDFSPQPWSLRRGELGHLWKELWSWKDPLGREWQLWFLAVFFGMPAMVVCLLAAPDDTDRIGSALGLAVTTLIGWLGLKAMDARIRRAHPDESDRTSATR